MCTAAASIGMQVFGAFTSAAGARQQASAAKAQAKAQAQSMLFQEQVAKNNAQIALWQAQDALQQGQQQEAMLRLENAGVKGAQKVGFASSGVALDSDSVIQTMVSTEYITEYDAATIRNNAARQAWGYEVERNNYLNQAISAKYGADMYNAQADSISPSKAMLSSLLGSAGQIGANAYGLYKSGAFGGSSGGSGRFLSVSGGAPTAFDVKSRF